MPQFESAFFLSLIFWEVLSFAILFFVLYKFAFPGILSVLEEREKKIKDSLDQAERHRSEAERTLKEYEAKLHAGGERGGRHSGSRKGTGAAADGGKRAADDDRSRADQGRCDA